jgi:para-nitrobenzyl esterase
MKRTLLLLLMTLGIAVGCGPAVPVHLAGIGNQSWQLVKFQGSDGTVLMPDDKAKYTVAFTNNGDLRTQFDCNRGRGVWILSGPNQIRFGPLEVTRQACVPGPLYDHLVKRWPYVRSYVVKDGRLFLSVIDNGGTYEFEPIAKPG